MVERADLVLELGVDINDINTGAFTLGVREERRILADHTGLRVGFRDYPGVTLRRPRSTASSGARCAAGRPPAAAAERLGRGPRRRRRASPATSSPSGSTRSCARRTSLVSDVGVAAHLLDGRPPRSGRASSTSPACTSAWASPVPAATGARLARGRGRPIVLVGDGSFQMTGMDLSTAVAHGLDPIVLVLDNHGYGAERAIVDGPFNDVARWDYTPSAAAVGAEGRRVATPQELDEALAEARAGAGRAWLLWIDLDAHDAPRALRALGEGLEHLMHATH